MAFDIYQDIVDNTTELNNTNTLINTKESESLLRDTNLGNRLTVIENDDSVTGSIDYKIKQAQLLKGEGFNAVVGIAGLSALTDLNIGDFGYVSEYDLEDGEHTSITVKVEITSVNASGTPTAHKVIDTEINQAELLKGRNTVEIIDPVNGDSQDIPTVGASITYATSVIPRKLIFERYTLSETGTFVLPKKPSPDYMAKNKGSIILSSQTDSDGNTQEVKTSQVDFGADLNSDATGKTMKLNLVNSAPYSGKEIEVPVTEYLPIEN